MADEADAGAEASAGCGGIAIAGAKASAMLLGFGQQILLSALLGADRYGELSRVLSWVHVVSTVVIASAMQGVSSVVSRTPAPEAGRAYRRVLRAQIVAAIAAAVLFAAVAGPVAAFASAPHVTVPLRVGALAVLFYGVTAPFVGALNGRRRFVEQALFDAGHAVLRAVLIVAGAIAFERTGHSGVVGATAGLVAATAIVAPIALWRAGAGEPGGTEPEALAYARFIVPVALGQAALSVLTQIDALLLSRFLGEAAIASGRPLGAADALVGVHRGVTLFAFLPYQMMSAVSFVLFPMLARASAAGDREAVRTYTRTGFRIALILTGLMCSVLSGLAPRALAFAFADPIFAERGGDALRILAVGMGGFAILAVTSAALTSLGRERDAAALTACAVGLVAIGAFLIVPRGTFGADMLVRSTLATSGALVVTAAAGAAILRRAAGAIVGAATFARVIVAAAIAIAAGAWLPWTGRTAVLFEGPMVGALYVIALIASGEASASDLERLKRITARA